MRAWFELVPPERFAFTYGGSEGHGLVMTTGDQWLEHPGTVGKPLLGEAKILDEDGNELPTGEIGEIYLSGDVTGPTLPATSASPLPSAAPGGFGSFGDMGYVDEDGFIYIADRRRDMIVTGGANVYPAEVEAVLTEHPGVLDVVVVGLPDPEWGHRVHAIVEAADPAHPPTTDELREHCQGAALVLQGAEDATRRSNGSRAAGRARSTGRRSSRNARQARSRSFPRKPSSSASTSRARRLRVGFAVHRGRRAAPVAEDDDLVEPVGAGDDLLPGRVRRLEAHVAHCALATVEGVRPADDEPEAFGAERARGRGDLRRRRAQQQHDGSEVGKAEQRRRHLHVTDGVPLVGVAERSVDVPELAQRRGEVGDHADHTTVVVVEQFAGAGRRSAR